MMLTGIDKMPPGATHMASRSRLAMLRLGSRLRSAHATTAFPAASSADLPEQRLRLLRPERRRARARSTTPGTSGKTRTSPDFRSRSLTLPAGPHRRDARRPSRLARRDRPPGTSPLEVRRRSAFTEHAGQSFTHAHRRRRQTRVRPRPRRPTHPRPLRPAHVRPVALAGSAAGRGRRADRAGQHGAHEQLGHPLEQLRPALKNRLLPPFDRGVSRIPRRPDDARPARRHARGHGRRIRPHAARSARKPAA